MLREQEVLTPTNAVSGEREIHIFRATRLNKLGIHAAEDPFRFGDERLSLARIDRATDTLYLGLLRHPFRGQHFLNIINEVTPSVKNGEEADWKMPDNARASNDMGNVSVEANEAVGGSVWLHHIHMTDPYIAPAYREFDSNHREEWLRQRQDMNGKGGLDRLHASTFIESTAEYGMEIFQGLISLGQKQKASPIIDGNVLSTVASAIRWTQTRFIDGFGIFDEVADLPGSIWAYEEGLDYLLQLTKAQQIGLGLVHALYQENKVLIDLNSGKFHVRENFYPASLSSMFFTSKDRVRISDEGSQSFYDITPGEHITPAQLSTVITDYRLPWRYYKEGLYPIFAWRKNSQGQRSFLTQTEVAEILPGVRIFKGFKVDVALGRVLATFFSEPIRAGLDKELELMQGRHPQNIMTGQVATMISLYTLPGYHGQPDRPGPATQLLSDENPLFPAMEKYTT